MINHFYQTFKHKAWVMILILRFCSQLIWRGIVHDLSKLGRIERTLFAKYTPELKNLKYGSEKYYAFMGKMQPAIDHHQRTNRHHPEYFGDIHFFRGMNLIDLIELWCDWNAALKRNKAGYILHSIKHGQTRFSFDDDLFCIFVNTGFKPDDAEKIIEEYWNR